MADYDFSKPAPDRSHRVATHTGTGTGGIGLIAVGVVIVLVVLYAVFGGAGVSTQQDPSSVVVPDATAPVEQAPIADPIPELVPAPIE